MSSWKNTFAVYKRELLGYFNSPLAYIILVIFLLAVQGFTFIVGGFLNRDSASLSYQMGFFSWHPWIYLMLVPAVGMRLWSEEHRLGTMELLMTMPISPWHAILGKYFAAATVWALALALTFPIVWTVFYLGEPDPGPIVSGYIASYLYALACLAITSAVSAFTRSQVICFIISVTICLVLFLMGLQQVVDSVLKVTPDSLTGVVKIIAQLCFMTHYEYMTKGLLVFRDVLYFVSVIAVCLMITHHALQSKRA
ncbi:ABC-2 type transport system permease protein [Roseimicrobium gellanilyticum]|uniref:ABC-2 type transport system permease protein n=1 Tax=Roseimicrobium gellanilyticum TaxID=748857 RepID=A0A366H433_9BACT|nr:ABC transporter permease [Roseimicrobium gellanilyticum]RBP35853.1 ABC-2 type transport system permease protein [Roseimicrobium gellanilyticum]